MWRSLAVLIMIAGSVDAASVTGFETSDLSLVHRIALRNVPKDRLSAFEKTLLSEIPGITLAPAEEADLVIEDSEVIRQHDITWDVELLRLHCQAPSADGRCDQHVYVRATLGAMSGVVRSGEDSVDAFVSLLKLAILTPGVQPIIEAPAVVAEPAPVVTAQPPKPPPSAEVHPLFIEDF